jgi:anti-sigma B factor antagonist
MTHERLDVSSRRTGTTVQVHADGELDIASAPALIEQAQAHLGEDTSRLVLDLSRVSFIDSSGLRALLNIAEEQPERLRIVPSEACSRVFEIAGVGDCLPLTDAVPEK